MENTNHEKPIISVIKRKIKRRQQRAKNNFWQTLKTIKEVSTSYVDELEYAYFL